MFYIHLMISLAEEIGFHSMPPTSSPGRGQGPFSICEDYLYDFEAKERTAARESCKNSGRPRLAVLAISTLQRSDWFQTRLPSLLLSFRDIILFPPKRPWGAA